MTQLPSPFLHWNAANGDFPSARFIRFTIFEMNFRQDSQELILYLRDWCDVRAAGVAHTPHTEFGTARNERIVSHF